MSDYCVFDRFAHYVDGTNRSVQKQLVKELLLAWMRYDLQEAFQRHFCSDVKGFVPYRGVGESDTLCAGIESRGYFQFSSREELATHIASEMALFPGIAEIVSRMSVSVEEKTVIFEGDRCVCEWRAWG